MKDREYPEEQPGCQREGSCKEECKSLRSMLLSSEVKVSSVVSGHCRGKGSNVKRGRVQCPRLELEETNASL